MLKKLHLSAALALAIGSLGFATTLEAAAPAQLNPYKGFYAGGQIGLGDRDKGSGDFFPFTSSYKEGGVALKGLAGYQFNRYLAVEGDYMYMSKDFFKNYQNNTDLAVKGMLPLSAKSDVFVKGGMGWINQGGTNGFQPLYGLGYDHYLSPKVSTTIEYDRFIGGGSRTDSNFLGFGMAYHF